MEFGRGTVLRGPDMLVCSQSCTDLVHWQLDSLEDSSWVESTTRGPSRASEEKPCPTASQYIEQDDMYNRSSPIILFALRTESPRFPRESESIRKQTCILVFL